MAGFGHWKSVWALHQKSSLLQMKTDEACKLRWSVSHPESLTWKGRFVLQAWRNNKGPEKADWADNWVVNATKQQMHQYEAIAIPVPAWGLFAVASSSGVACLPARKTTRTCMYKVEEKILMGRDQQWAQSTEVGHQNTCSWVVNLSSCEDHLLVKCCMLRQ